MRVHTTTLLIVFKVLVMAVGAYLVERVAGVSAVEAALGDSSALYMHRSFSPPGLSRHLSWQFEQAVVI